MESLLIFYISITVFGLGVTLVDMFGLLGDEDSEADSSQDTSDDIPELSLDASDSDDEADGDGKHPGGSLMSADENRPAGHRFFRFVSKSVFVLRSLVYFSLGAGPTGLFGILTGYSLSQVIAWSAGAGLGILVLARFLRALARKDLDSTIHIHEYLLDEAVITVSVLPGQIGKGIVRRYEREIELYLRSQDPDETLRRGDRVRIVDIQDEICIVEKQ